MHGPWQVYVIPRARARAVWVLPRVALAHPRRGARAYVTPERPAAAAAAVYEHLKMNRSKQPSYKRLERPTSVNGKSKADCRGFIAGIGPKERAWQRRQRRRTACTGPFVRQDARGREG